MSEDVKIEENEVEPIQIEPTHASTAAKQVEEVKEALQGAVSETSLPEKVADLRFMLDNLSEEIEGWKKLYKTNYLEGIETLKSQVDEIQTEWNNVSGSLKAQGDKLESLLETFPGAIDTVTIKAISLRVTHLERLVSQMFQESQAKTSAVGTRKQYIISLVALGVTIILWGVYIGLNVFG